VTSCDGWQGADRVSDGHRRPLPRFWKEYRPETRSKQNEASAILRNAIHGGIKNIPLDLIPEVAKSVHELCPELQMRQSWHIFHRNDFWKQFLGNTEKFEQEAPPVVGGVPAGCVSGEWLTGSATSQNLDCAFTEELLETPSFDGGNVALQKGGANVLFEGKSASRVKVYPGADVDSRLLEAQREPCRAAKHVNCRETSFFLGGHKGENVPWRKDRAYQTRGWS